jgi:hypothetical protein
MKLIDKAIRELTEERVKKIKFSKGSEPKGVAPLKPKKSSGDTHKVGAASDTTKKGSWSADQDITTGEHYDELDKANKRMKKYDHSISGDYDDDAKDVVKVHEMMGQDYDDKFAGMRQRDSSYGDSNVWANAFQAEVDQSAPSSEVDRITAEFYRARKNYDVERMKALTEQLKAHNNMTAGGEVTEGVSRILQLAGVKDVREMLVVHPKKELDEEGEEKKKSAKQEHGLIEEDHEYWDDDGSDVSGRTPVRANRYKKEHHQQFVEAVEEAGLTPYHYRGRFYYDGPAVDYKHPEKMKLYASLHNYGFTGDDIQEDSMGLDTVAYPRN